VRKILKDIKDFVVSMAIAMGFIFLVTIFFGLPIFLALKMVASITGVCNGP
jgi:hypothetical protein